MPARSGKDYLTRLREQRPAQVWIGGERVLDVTSHPALKRGAESVAHLYDMQVSPELRDQMTYLTPEGSREGLSFIVPTTVEELQRRRDSMFLWARSSGGMMGRSPDYMNAGITAMASSAAYFGQNRPEFAKNIVSYYEYIRDNDLTLTHTLVNLQRSRPPAGSALTDSTTDVALQVVEERDDGVVVNGARVLATLGPLSDEIAVYPPRSHQFAKGTHSKYAIAFAIPCNTEGMKLICRDSFDTGRSRFDNPLSSRYEEMDALVIFDHVFVPWERVFLYGDAELCNNMAMATNQYLHAGHQVVVKNIAKAELVVGLAALMAETLGSAEQATVKQQMAELITSLEVQKALLAAAEAQAAPDEWGMMAPALTPIMVARNLFMEAYPRMTELVQLLGSSSLMAIPPEAAFSTEIGADLSYYLETDSASAEERVKLFRLAWDVCCSSFAGRQILYERFFQGDIVRNALLLDSSYDKTGLMEQARQFIQ